MICTFLSSKYCFSKQHHFQNVAKYFQPQKAPESLPGQWARTNNYQLIWLFCAFFSHPDCTVGFGISPNQPPKRVADYTAGREFRNPKMKVQRFLYQKRVSLKDLITLPRRNFLCSWWIILYINAHFNRFLVNIEFIFILFFFPPHVHPSGDREWKFHLHQRLL